jgi:putative oxidoreductase
VVTVHLPKGFWVAKGVYEFNLALLAAVAALALTGPGAYSLDAALRIQLPEPFTVIAVAIALVIGVTVTLVTRSPQQATERKPQTT